MEIIRTIIAILIIVLCWRQYKNSESELGKLLYLSLTVTGGILIIIYNLDKFNIPTKYNWTENINTQNWLMFLGAYLPSILSAFIGAFILIAVTNIQIKYNKEDNEKRDMENLRIQNMPILKYSVNTLNGNVKFNDIITTNIKGGKPYNLNLEIQNIGLNMVRNLKIDFYAEFFKKNYRIEGNNTLITISKDEIFKANKRLSLEQSQGQYDFKIIVYYQDILTNWYSQQLNVHYETINRGHVLCSVCKEQKLSNNEILELKLDN